MAMQDDLEEKNELIINISHLYGAMGYYLRKIKHLEEKSRHSIVSSFIGAAISDIKKDVGFIEDIIEYYMSSKITSHVYNVEFDRIAILVSEYLEKRDANIDCEGTLFEIK